MCPPPILGDAKTTRGTLPLPKSFAQLLGVQGRPRRRREHSSQSWFPPFNVGSFTPKLNLRAIDIDGAPWFLAKDVCAALGYTAVVAGVLTKHVEAEDRSKFNMNTLSNREPIRGNPLSLVINESGLYSLTLGSEQAEAKTFKRWVTSEVLPAIRRNGGYMTPEVAVMATESPAVFLARALPKASESGKSKAIIGRVPKYVFV